MMLSLGSSRAGCSPSTVGSYDRAPADSMIWLPRGYRDDGRDGGQEGGECQQRGGEGCRGGEAADQKGAAGVAEFAADFGGAQCLSEPFGGGGGSQVGESDRGDDTDPAADQERGDHQSGDARYHHGRAADRSQREPRGQAGALADAASVTGASTRHTTTRTFPGDAAKQRC